MNNLYIQYNNLEYLSSKRATTLYAYSMDAGRSECKFRQVSVTRVFLRLRHATS